MNRLFKKATVVILSIIIAVIAILLSIFLLFFKPPIEAHGFKEYHQVKYVDHDTIEYNGVQYNNEKSDLNEIIKDNVENLSLISWHKSFHLRNVLCYSHSSEAPDYILCDGSVYYKDSFDSSDIVFNVKDSNFEIAYSDTFTYKGDFTDREDYNYYDTFTFRVKSHPELKVRMKLYVNDESEYMYTISGENNAPMHTVSNTFLNMMINNGIIEVCPFDGDINDFIISDGVSSYFREGGPKIMKCFELKKNGKVIDLLCIVEYERNYDLLSLVSPDGGKTLILMTLKDHIWVNKEYFITNKAMDYQLQFKFSNKELGEWDYIDIIECPYKGEKYWFGVDYVKIIRTDS